MYKIFFIIFKKELKDNFLNNKAWFTIAFFLLCLLVFPLSFGASTNFQNELSIPAIWVSALFANLIALDQMYKEDYSDGTLTYYLINDIPFSSVVIAKCLSHWFFCGVPIIILSPFCLYVLSGSFFSYNLIIMLLIGTPLLTLIGSPISALMLGSRVRGPIITFITLPFYFPIIIFGIMGTSQNNYNLNAEFYLLLSMLSIVVVFFPLLTIKILKSSIN